jgi:Family of unknown function (DUF5677)
MSPSVGSPKFRRAMEACWAVHRAGNDVPKPLQKNVETGLIAPTVQGIISGTAARCEKTFEAVLHLSKNGYTQQAAMLIRSMFEDVIVAHWLLLHEDEGEFYGERFLRHQHAMYLAADRVSKRYGAPTADLSEIRDHEADLEAEFGPTAERSWWGRNAMNESNRLPAMVAEIGSADRFWGRTYGETPILRETYDMVVKWANQFLHHTAFGITMVHVDEAYLAIASPHPADVIGRAYYNYAMAICAVIDAAGETPQFTPFWQVFMGGLPIIAEATAAKE